MYQLGAKQFTLNPINHQNKETASRKASHRKNLRYSKYMYLKHWKTFETTLTAESKYLLAKIALLIHPMVWCKGRTTGPGPRDRGTRDRRSPQSLKVGPWTTLKFKNGTPGPPAHYCKWNTFWLVLPSKFKKGTLIIIFLYCLTSFVLDKYVYNMEIIFHE